MAKSFVGTIAIITFEVGFGKQLNNKIYEGISDK